MPKLTRACALVACLLVFTGCKVDADVNVTLREDGTGTIETDITLDGEAVARVETNARWRPPSRSTTSAPRAGRCRRGSVRTAEARSSG